MASKKKNSTQQKTQQNSESQTATSEKQDIITSDLSSLSERKEFHRKKTSYLIAILVSLTLTYTFIILIVNPDRFWFVNNILNETNNFLLALFICSAATLLYSASKYYYYIAQKREQTTFQDIDKARKKADLSPKIDLDDIKELPKPVPWEEKYALDKKIYSLEEKIRNCETQKYLFLKITDSLTEQVELFDEKASAMLDEGINKATFGVWFLIFSIVGWQLFFLYYAQPVDPRHYVGMASCSVIFIFMQALAGWCLKQHRAYIDASLYVIKIRSIFEKKMQAYLLMQEHSENKGGYQKVLDTFLEEISWPPEPLSAKKQASYVKEAAATISEVTSAMRTLHPTPQKPTRRNRSPLL